MTRSFLTILVVVLQACTSVPEKVTVDDEPVAAARDNEPAIEADEPETVPEASADGFRVGVLVPLSGEHGELGHSLLDAATLALFDVGRRDIELVVADTAEGAVAAARQVVIAGADAVIGPLLPRSVNEAAAMLAGLQRHVFTLSPGDAAGDRGILVMGHTADHQIRRLVNHAVATGNMRFALLAPMSPFGERMAGLLHDAVGEAGGFVTAEVFHDPSGKNVDAAVATLAATRVDPGDIDRAVSRLQGQGGLAAEVAIERLRGSARLRAFDAVFVPASGLLLQRIAAWMGHHGFLAGHVQLFGLNSLDDAALFREPVMNGAWFAVPPDAGRSAMLRRFRDAFSYDPGDAVTIAYDTMALVSAVLSGPQPRRIDDWRGFGGIDGLFRFRADGRTERLLAVMRITPAGPVIEDAAPAAFTPLADSGT